MRGPLDSAGDTVRACVTAGLPLIVAVYALVFAALAPLVADLSIGAHERAVRDVGLWLLWLLASAAAAWVGVREAGASLREGPARSSDVLGRYAGGVVVVVAVVAGLAAAYAVVAAWRGVPSAGILDVAVMVACEAGVLVGVGLLLGATTSPGIASLGTTALWVLGHVAGELARAAATSGPGWLAGALRALAVVVPDLRLFDVQARVVHDAPVAGAPWALAYGGAWMLVLYAATAAVIGRRDARGSVGSVVPSDGDAAKGEA